MSIEAMKQALEAWESGDGLRLGEILRTAIEQAEKQEPVAKVAINAAGQISIQTPEGNAFDVSKHVGAVFYNTPPAYEQGWKDGYKHGAWAGSAIKQDLTPAPAAPVQGRVKVWDAEGYDSLMQQMELLRSENQRLKAAPVQVEHCIWARNGNTPCPHTAAPVQEHELALYEAKQIATWLWKNFYKDKAPQWEVLPDICGVLSQIDNMVAGLKYDPPAAPVQEKNNG